MATPVIQWLPVSATSRTRHHLLDQNGITLHRDDDTDGEAMNVWSAAEVGEIPIEEVEAAHAENLDVVLPHVERLLEELPGRTVVTADHGNLVGDRLSPIPVRGDGHPRGLRVPELVTVPWLEVPGERIDAVAEPPTTTDVDDSHAADRLAALGYVRSRSRRRPSARPADEEPTALSRRGRQIESMVENAEATSAGGLVGGILLFALGCSLTLFAAGTDSLGTGSGKLLPVGGGVAVVAVGLALAYRSLG